MQRSSTIKIREFLGNDPDYKTLAEIINTVEPGEEETPETLRFWDEKREKKIRWKRYFAEINDVVVGYGMYSQFTDYFHPQKFFVSINVLPTQENKGAGQALMQHLHTQLITLKAITVRCNTKLDREHAIRFLAASGFKEDFRYWESKLNPQTFDEIPYANLFAKLSSEKIELVSLTQIKNEPEWQKEMLELYNDSGRDMPDPETYTDISFERFTEAILQSPDLSPDSWLLAVKRNPQGKLEYLAESSLWRSPGSIKAHNGGTGTRHAWRRKGLALALKVKNIVWAKQQGITEIKTFNDSINRPMLSINETLGFQKEPAWVWMIKHL